MNRYSWTTKDGKDILVEDMTNEHMWHVSQHLERKVECGEIESLPPVYFAIKLELVCRARPELRAFKDAYFGLLEAQMLDTDEQELLDVIREGIPNE